MKDVALITLHGMGKIKPSYYEDLEKALREKLGTNWTKVSFQNVQYAPILQGPQDALWKAMIASPENELDAVKLRQFFLFGFGDAGSLEHSANTDKQQYIDIQRQIQKAIDNALLDFDGDASKPIVVIAQSLGCQVISNYIWDKQHGNNIFKEPSSGNAKKDEFRKLNTLSNLITTGCNIPLFVAGIADRVCFEKPSTMFTWDNFYDQDDILGWPLKQLGPTYDIVRDHSVNSGGLLSSWNVASHGEYWSDKDVTNSLAAILKSKLT